MPEDIAMAKRSQAGARGHKPLPRWKGFGFLSAVSTPSASAGGRFFEQVHGVYFDDLDAFQVLHNARYVLLAERTIGGFWRQLGLPSPLSGGEGTGDAFQLVRANHIEYLKAIEGVGEVRVRVWVDTLGKTSLTFGFCVMPIDVDVDHAVGQRVMVRIDPKTRAPVPWSDTLRTKLQPWVRKVK